MTVCVCIVCVSVRARVSFSVAAFALTPSKILQFPVTYAPTPRLLLASVATLSTSLAMPKHFLGAPQTHTLTHTHTGLIFTDSHITHTPGMARHGHMSLVCAAYRALLRNLIVLIAICLDRSNLIRIFNETLRS